MNQHQPLMAYAQLHAVRSAMRRLTISSGLKIPNCTFFTCLSGADESLQKLAMLHMAPGAGHLRPSSVCLVGRVGPKAPRESWARGSGLLAASKPQQTAFLSIQLTSANTCTVDYPDAERGPRVTPTDVAHGSPHSPGCPTTPRPLLLYPTSVYVR